MEKDELKDIWNVKGSVSESETDMEVIYSAKSNNLIDKILNTIKFEQGMNYLIIPIVIIAFAFFKEYVWSLIALILGIGTIIYYKNMITTLSRTETSLSVLDYLESSYQVIKRFRNHYLLIGIVMFFVGFSMTSSIISDFTSGNFENLPLSLLGIGALIILAIAIVYGIFHVMYGRNIKLLRRSIDELKNT